MSAAKRSWSTNEDYSNIYGLMPNYDAACKYAPVVGQNYPESMMATNDNGLAVAAYSPSTVKAKVEKGVEVTIREIIDYP